MDINTLAVGMLVRLDIPSAAGDPCPRPATVEVADLIPDKDYFYGYSIWEEGDYCGGR